MKRGHQAPALVSVAVMRLHELRWLQTAALRDGLEFTSQLTRRNNDEIIINNKSTSHLCHCRPHDGLVLARRQSSVMASLVQTRKLGSLHPPILTEYLLLQGCLSRKRLPHLETPRLPVL